MRSLSLLLVVGCVGGSEAPTYETFEMQPVLPTPLDVLVVLDDTTAMADHLPRPGVDQLAIYESIYNGAPDIRIGVTTTTTGTLRTSPTVPEGFVEHRRDFGDGKLHMNYAGSLSYALGTLTTVGASSTAPNQVFDSAQRALATPGFVRDNSAVGILVITAADDASPGEVAPYVTGVQAHGRPTMVSAIHGDVAMPRLRAFADAIPLRAMRTIGAYDMEALTIFAQLWPYTPYTNSCMPIAPTKVGGDYDCEMFMAKDGVTRVLPRCGGGVLTAPEACWQLADDSSCNYGVYLAIGGGFSMYRPHVIGRCAVN